MSYMFQASLVFGMCLPPTEVRDMCYQIWEAEDKDCMYILIVWVGLEISFSMLTPGLGFHPLLTPKSLVGSSS